MTENLELSALVVRHVVKRNILDKDGNWRQCSKQATFLKDQSGKTE